MIKAIISWIPYAHFHVDEQDKPKKDRGRSYYIGFFVARGKEGEICRVPCALTSKDLQTNNPEQKKKMLAEMAKNGKDSLLFLLEHQFNIQEHEVEFEPALS